MSSLRTRGDILFFLLVSTLVTAMGLALLLSPGEPLPDDPGAYTVVDGTLDAVTRRSSRGTDSVIFRLQDTPRRFDARGPGFDELAASWRPRQTHLRFLVLRTDAARPHDDWPLRAYALQVDGQTLRGFAADRADSLRQAQPWGAVMALAIGLLGLGLGAVLWRRLTRRTAPSPALTPARPRLPPHP